MTGTALPAVSLSAAERDLAERLVPDESTVAAQWAVAVMELGALVCTARSPRCGECPVLGLCAWQRRGAPAYTGPPRRGQRYAGTDRYVRGLLLAALRAAETPPGLDELLGAIPDSALRAPDSDPLQRQRCLDSLMADGLVELLTSGGATIPVAHQPPTTPPRARRY